MTFNNMSIMLPWFSNLIDEDRALLGDDWWPYGIQHNRSAIDVVLRYHQEQGFTESLHHRYLSKVPSPRGASAERLRIRRRHRSPALALQQHTKHQSVRYEQQRNDRCGNEIGGAELPWR